MASNEQIMDNDAANFRAQHWALALTQLSRPKKNTSRAHTRVCKLEYSHQRERSTIFHRVLQLLSKVHSRILQNRQSAECTDQERNNEETLVVDR